MSKTVKNKQHNSGKKTYQQPRLRTLGSVQGLTLKTGSLTDSGQPGSFM